MAEVRNILINYLKSQDTGVDISTLRSKLNNRFSTNDILDACEIGKKAGIFFIDPPEKSTTRYIIYRSAFVDEVIKIIKIYFDNGDGDDANFENLVKLAEEIAKKENIGEVNIYLLLSEIIEQKLFYKARYYCLECMDYQSMFTNKNNLQVITIESGLKEKLESMQRDVLPATDFSPCIICGLTNKKF